MKLSSREFIFHVYDLFGRVIWSQDFWFNTFKKFHGLACKMGVVFLRHNCSGGKSSLEAWWLRWVTEISFWTERCWCLSGKCWSGEEAGGFISVPGKLEQLSGALKMVLPFAEYFLPGLCLSCKKEEWFLGLLVFFSWWGVLRHVRVYLCIYMCTYIHFLSWIISKFIPHS